MSFKKTLLFGALLLGLLSYIYYVEIPEEKESARQKKFLNAFSADSISEITFKKDKASFTIENSSPKSLDKKESDVSSEYVTKDSLSNWKIKENASAALEQSSLNAILSTLSSLELGTPVPKEERESDLASYGLTAPRLELTVRGGGGKESTLKWGKTNEYSSKDYVQSGDEIFLVPTSQFSSLNKERDDFRNKAPVSFSDGNVKTLELLASGKEKVSIERNDTGDYRILSPYPAPASEDVVSGVLRSLKGLRVSKFIDDDSKSSLFKSPSFLAKLDFKDSAPSINVEVASEKIKGEDKSAPPSSKFYFKLSEGGGAFELASDPTINLSKDADAISDLKPFKVSTFLVEKVEVEPRGKEKIVLEKKDSKWMVSGEVGDEKSVTGYIEGVAGIKAASYVSKHGPISENPDKDYGFGDASFKISIKLLSEGSVPVVYLIGGDAPKKMGENMVFASKGDKKDPFLISKASLDGTLIPDPKTLKETESTSPASP